MIRYVKARMARYDDPMSFVICVLCAIATGVLLAYRG